MAGQVLTETANLEQISPRHQPKLERIREWLIAILTEQVPSDYPFPSIERVLTGNILAVLGDPRPGVGLQKDGFPDIEWCEVPAGTFIMGSNVNDYRDARDDEQPQHEVHLPAYQISRYPITNAQYQAFVEDGGYTEKWKQCWTMEGWVWKEQIAITEPQRFGGAFDLSNHPVVGVSWYEASAFCQWLTIQLLEQGALAGDQNIIRLPSEAEWEKAARGTDKRIYPWGNEISSSEYANYEETGLGITSPVGCFPRGTSPYGCEDMAGNVWEWCLDAWHDNYVGAPTDRCVWEEGDNFNTCLLRGGSWNNSAHYCRCAFRHRNAPDFRYGYHGFRIVRTPS